MTPRPVTPISPPTSSSPVEKSTFILLLATCRVALSATMCRALDLSWLASVRDLLLFLGFGLLIHAVSFWSRTAAEFVAGLFLLALFWGLTPPSPPPDQPSGKPVSRPPTAIGGR
jgi:hypothetical protein